MKNTRIKKLNFKDSGREIDSVNNSGSSNTIRVSWNSNEDEETLDIAIHHIENPVEYHQYYYSINNQQPYPISKETNDVIIKNIQREKIIGQGKPRPRSGKEAIYQFSVQYKDLKSGDNVITIFEDSNSTQGLAAIEFFAEGEEIKTISLARAGVDDTPDEDFWVALNNRITDQRLKFSEYKTFIDAIICSDLPQPSASFPDFQNPIPDRPSYKTRSPFIRSEEYNLIKFATDFYMARRLGLDTSHLSTYTSNPGRLPYYDLIMAAIDDEDGTLRGILPTDTDPDCKKNLSDRIFRPIMIELIWNYWMEQGMLVQTMNVINLRFQNIKGNFYADKLQRFDTDPLRPMSYILWGYIQDEQHRLALPRRLNEYDHEYGLTLTGRAVPRINPVDSRVKFLEAFHSLLTQCTIFFKEADDTTRIADGFPMLNSLKEVHLLLAEGNHNAYGSLTWTARQEMMIQQYILSRSEMREFLGGKVMVPYPEIWMDRVDTMRNLQGWGGTGIIHYYELAIHGELILLSIRYGNWSDVSLSGNNAANWALKIRNSIQRYVHAYRAVTGVDMSVDQIMQLPGNFAIQPAYLIEQRLMDERVRTRRRA